MFRTAVVIPALDEEATIGAVLADVPVGCRVVVADNGSVDRTAQISRDAGAEVVSAARRGYGSAVLAGLARLAADPPDVVAILDADYADHPELLPLLTGPIARDHADLVLSDRSITAAPGALQPAQRIGNRLATALIRLAIGARYRDLGPFRAIRWTSLQQLQMRDPSWGWNVEMQMKAARHGLRVREVPMPYRARGGGQSKISGTIVGTARAGVRILAAVRRYRID